MSLNNSILADAALRKNLLLGLGNPLLDISARVDSEFLTKYNLKPNDAILAGQEHNDMFIDLIKNYEVSYIAGGSVQNTLRTIQWLVGKPEVAVYFGCVGCDNYSKILEEKAKGDGVNVVYQKTDKAPTGTCAVLLTEQFRSLCANLGAANLFTIDHVLDNRRYLEEAEYYYISGFFLTVSPPSIMEVAKYACEKNRPFIMNLSAPFISEFFSEPLLKALPYVDILFGNETEAQTFAKKQNWDTENLKEIGKKLQSWPKENANRPRIVIITQGHDPVLLIEKDNVAEFNVEELKEIDIVDTNGAGDAFVGGFLAQYIQKKPLDICIKCGIQSARHVIQQSGCTFEGKANFLENL